MVEYHDQFDAVTSPLDLSDAHLLSCFLVGLKKDIQMTLRMFQPKDVRKAFQLAKLYESNIHTKTFPKIQKTHFSTTAILPTPNPIHKPPNSQLHLSTNQRRPNKKLTPAFMAERRSKGLLFLR